MSRLVAILMAGGSGTRFWPASRVSRPKQLLPIGTDEPLLLHTSSRLADLIPPERQIIVTSARYVDQVRDLLPDVPPEQVLGEPEGRDTAPCIGLASRIVERLDPEGIAVAMPSDHVISPVDVFLDHLAAAEEALADHPDSVLVFGVEPDRPATGYGYLRAGAEVGRYRGHAVHALDAFVEKPMLERAEAMVEQGGHTWNAGMFAFRPATLGAAYGRFLPEMGGGLDRIARAWKRDEFERTLIEVFPTLEKVSIDFGVMEKLRGCLMMPLSIRWDDVGSWSALDRLRLSDAAGNVVDGEAVVIEGSNNLIASTNGVVAVKGVDDMIIVHTPDATLVCRRDDDQGVKQVVEELRARGLEKYL